MNNSFKRAGLGWASGVMAMCFGTRLQEYLGYADYGREPDLVTVVMNAVIAVVLFGLSATGNTEEQ